MHQFQMGKTKLEIGEDEAGERGSASNVSFHELNLEEMIKKKTEQVFLEEMTDDITQLFI